MCPVMYCKTVNLEISLDDFSSHVKLKSYCLKSVLKDAAVSDSSSFVRIQFFQSTRSGMFKRPGCDSASL